jgi:hypothetical protein
MADKMYFEATIRIMVRPCSSTDTAEAVQERLNGVIEENLDTCTLDDFYTVLDVKTTLTDVK